MRGEEGRRIKQVQNQEEDSSGVVIASFPGSPPRAQVYSVTFDLHKKLCGSKVTL